ncbi:MAG: cobalt-precorrin-5B (C(1))-methyltransferase CbiD [Clostridiaceae bacterium]|nr:cobalt-precorrin-5B (C(1))-methyltransferase CbiD [Clostridiaceae bacterium]
MESRRFINQKLLRCGYTTGSCAAAAAKAAACMLLTGEILSSVSIRTPEGIQLTMDVQDPEVYSDKAVCAVRKDSGDDPDVTNGILVFAAVSPCAEGIEIDGGEGIGRVTKAGLDQPVGAAAINSVPRGMIRQEVEQAMRVAGYTGGLRVIISAPEGAKLASRTFNPHMGIEGGISVLGTSGIVEPMSNAALVDTIRAEVSMLRAEGRRDLLITLGNYGEDYAKNTLCLSLDSHVKCSNFIGDAIAAAMEQDFLRVMIIGHIGKLVKLGIGMMNTHSDNGDGRMETLAACALEAGAELQLLRKIMGCVSTDAALSLLYERDLLKDSMEVLKRRIEYHLSRHVLPGRKMEFLCFTNTGEYAGTLFMSNNAKELMKLWRRD